MITQNFLCLGLTQVEKRNRQTSSFGYYALGAHPDFERFNYVV
ncbi:hypothetical protein FDUTEX481_04736 [Tolypothrix sp. PCC 7601]|nr:hypothetical protein FDUTEX481_04736 [Tolypothrix sp. PCC 7601]